jgi:hypothetical protein
MLPQWYATLPHKPLTYLTDCCCRDQHADDAYWKCILPTFPDAAVKSRIFFAPAERQTREKKDVFFSGA